MNFENMSDNEVEISLGKNVTQERNILHVILEHIREVDARKLHLKRAYPNLKMYLVETFGYSGSAADRRIEAARLMKDVPAIAEKVRDGVLNLSQISEVHSAIKQKERVSGVNISAAAKSELVESVTGLTAWQAQQQLSQVLDIPVKQYEKLRLQQDGSGIAELTLSKTALEKINRGKELLAQKLTQQHLEINMANVIEYALVQLVDSLDFEDCNEKQKASHVQKRCDTQEQCLIQDQDQRQNQNQIKNQIQSQICDDLASNEMKLSNSQNDGEKEETSTKNSTQSDTDAGNSERGNKTLTPKTRNFVLQKSGCCEFKDPVSGRVCGSKFALQVDHVKSRRMGGDHSVENLQTLCAQHNRFKFEQERNIELRFFG